jgi:response regulator NasT
MVVDGLAVHRIRPLLDLAVRRFNAFARLQTDLAEARGKLAERETIDKAKRILMQSKNVAEPEAYAELRRKAMSLEPAYRRHRRGGGDRARTDDR